MTRFSDLDPDQQAAHLAGVQRSLDRADQALAETEAWRAERRDIEWEGQRQARQRREDEEYERAQRVPEMRTGRNWAVEQKWIEQIIDQMVGRAVQKWVHERLKARLDKFAESMGEAMGRVAKEERAAMLRQVEDRIAKSDAATVELLLDAEKRIAVLERRLADKPRLIGGSGAAA